MTINSTTRTLYISYCRVSTDKQGISGLGLEAQRTTVTRYMEQQGATAATDLIGEFVEVESGTRNNRPQMDEALRNCRLTGAVLLVAKLDRLSRDVGFIDAMVKSKVTFVACDFPTANSSTIGIFAALAAYERDLISQRTKAALAARRQRGLPLGTPGNMTPDISAAGRATAAANTRRRVEAYLADATPLVQAARSEGLTLQQVADRLNASPVLTAGGKRGAWTATAVSRVLAGGAR